MNGCHSSPPRHLSCHCLILRARPRIEMFDALPLRQRPTFALAEKTMRNVGVERDLKPWLEPTEAIPATEIVVVENIAKEDVENLPRCAPVARFPR